MGRAKGLEVMSVKGAAARIVLRCGLVFGVSLSSCVAQEKISLAPEAEAGVERSQNPDLLSFDELVTLASTAKPEGGLGARLNSLLNTPFVQSESAASEIQPHRPSVPSLGVVLRVAQWNIERGLNFDLIRSALADPGEFLRRPAGNDRTGGRRRDIVESQLARLQAADILILNEVDRGMKRTGYRDVARELAAALHMNYVYGVEFVEVDPVFELGTEPVHLADAQEDRRLREDLQVDAQRYYGLHGTAILSRYPIERAR